MAPDTYFMNPLTKTRFLLILSCCGLVFLLAAILCPAVGPTRIDLLRALSLQSDSQNLDRTIFFVARLPRTLFAASVGAALAVSGVVFQALLRNALATPFTLGVSSGSSLGAVLAIRLGLDRMFWGVSLLPVAAFLGAGATILLVYSVAKSRTHLPTVTLLLAGVTLSFVFSAFILFLHHLSDFTQSYQMLRWMMGSLDVLEYSVTLRVLPFVAVGFGMLLALSRRLNLLTAGEELAASRGVDVARTLKTGYFAASLMTGAVTAFSGPIGFVGLIVPHTLRLLIGADHRILLPASLLIGGAFLMVCDALSRILMPPVEIPVGIITAILGGPFFIWLLKTKREEVVF